MTTCHDMRLQLAAYADDELGVDAAIAVELHRAECSACRRELGRHQQLTRALRELHPVVEPPDGFTERVRSAVLGPTLVRPAVGTWAIAAVVAVVGLAWWGSATMGVWDGGGREIAASRTSSESAPAVVAAAALHRRAGTDTLRLDLVSHDVGEVNDWLRRRLPFAGEIGTPSSDVTLEGAAVVGLADRPAGLIRYRMHGRAVSLFLLAEPAWTDDQPPVRVGGVDFRVFARSGLDLVGWSHAPRSYLLVSEGGIEKGEACATCHAGNDRRVITDFVAAVAGRATEL